MITFGKENLVENLDMIHTTGMGVDRIRNNLNLSPDEDVVQVCKNAITDQKSEIIRKGKNWYVKNKNNVFTVNASSFTIITAHKN